jgi:hypothetical protein
MLTRLTRRQKARAADAIEYEYRCTEYEYEYRCTEYEYEKRLPAANGQRRRTVEDPSPALRCIVSRGRECFDTINRDD